MTKVSSQCVLGGALLVVGVTARAGTVVSPSTATLPVDSPFAIGALALTVLVIGYRLLRKK